MNTRSFDALARSLVDAKGNRRVGLRLLVGGAFATMLTGVGLGEAIGANVPGCVALGKRCRRDKDCCYGSCKRGRCKCPKDHVPNNGACVIRRACAVDQDCPGGKVCVNGLCKCPPGWGDCEYWDACGPMDAHPYYCGACDNHCADGESCSGGQCVR
jgi:hypothetical protein